MTGEKRFHNRGCQGVRIVNSQLHFETSDSFRFSCECCKDFIAYENTVKVVRNAE
jgi:hypothetical protein